MADGTTKPIKDIQIGDQVIATDPETGTTQPKTVTHLHLNQDEDLANVIIQNQETGEISTLETTWNHPFWNTTEQTWTNAADLEPGTHLRDNKARATQRVLAVHIWTGHAEMLDLTVADIHTYYVIAGNAPVLVHNCGKSASIGNKFDVPNRPGVYTIHLADGSKYVGSASNNMRGRVNAALMDPDHSVAKAGYSIPDVVNVTWIQLPGRKVTEYVARRLEQSVMDGIVGPLVNTKYPEFPLWYHN